MKYSSGAAAAEAVCSSSRPFSTAAPTVAVLGLGSKKAALTAEVKCMVTVTVGSRLCAGHLHLPPACLNMQQGFCAVTTVELEYLDRNRV